MNESVIEHRVIHLHKMLIEALSKSTVKKPVTLSALLKLGEPVFGGTKIVGQFLEQLSVAKAITRSSGMKDGESYVSYWVTANFDEFTKNIRSGLTRSFTVAEKALIRKVHGFMPTEQLRDILNERLVCDLGPDAVPYSMEQLYAEIGEVAGTTPVGGHDWSSLRKLLAKAKSAGVLASINEQVINDFAIVFSLNSKQVLCLKDIVLQPEEELS